MAMTTMYELLQPNKERPPTPVKRLLRLPSTAEVESKLQTYIEMLSHASQPVYNPHSPPYFDALAHERAVQGVQSEERRLAECGERDVIQATRPEGCWCLGLGGDVERTTGADSYFDKTCTCPEGLGAAQHKETIREAQRKQRNEERIETVWDNALIPARFLRFRLDTSPWLIAHPEMLPLLAAKDERSIQSWFLYGPYGGGKTGIAVGLAWQKVVDDGSLALLRFVAGPRLFSELRSTYNRDSGETEQKVIDRYAEADLLILDDIGAEQVKNQDWLADRLYQIVGERHDELRATIFTSNLTLEQLAKRVGERVTWRIVEMVGKNIIHVDGPNLRA